jgi:hypothetical protein
MIKNITGGQYIQVMGGSNSYPYVNMSNPSAGMMRYNGLNQNIEVYDGSNWMTISGNSSMIDLNNDAKELLEWARAKRAEELYLKREAEKNPTIKDLLNQRDTIDSKITMVRTLIQNHNEYGEAEAQASP